MIDAFILIGAGGTGSHLIRPLVQYLYASRKNAWWLHIVDGDTVEARNLERQAFSHDDIGKPKAQAIIRNAHINTTNVGFTVDMLTPLNDQIIRNGSTVFIAADNYAARRTVDNRAAQLQDITIINGGNETYSTSCQIHVRRNGINLTPRISFLHEEILTGDTAQHSCHNGPEQTIAANMTSATWMLNALINLDHFPPESLPWHEIHTDLLAGTTGGPDWRIDGGPDWATWAPEGALK